MGGVRLKQHVLLDIIRERDCAVLGYGVSNRPLVEWLVAHGARSVTVRDQRSPDVMFTCQIPTHKHINIGYSILYSPLKFPILP